MQVIPSDQHPEIRSGRILLRELTTADVPFLLQIMNSDGRNTYTLPDAAERLRSIADDYRSGRGISWVVANARTGTAMGTIGYYRGFANGRGEIGFVLLPAFEGSGYMSEAVALVVRFGRETLQLGEIVAVTRPSNERAIRLLERLGFASKGIYDANYIWYMA